MTTPNNNGWQRLLITALLGLLLGGGGSAIFGNAQVKAVEKRLSQDIEKLEKKEEKNFEILLQLSDSVARMETSLHRQLKERYAVDGAEQEVRLDDYRIDVVSGDQLVEIQHGSLSAIRDKVRRLLKKHSRVWMETISNDISRGQKEGLIYKELDPEVYIVMLVHLMVAGIGNNHVMSALFSTGKKTKNEDMARYLKELMRFARAGLMLDGNN